MVYPTDYTCSKCHAKLIAHEGKNIETVMLPGLVGVFAFVRYHDTSSGLWLILSIVCGAYTVWAAMFSRAYKEADNK